MSVDLREIEKVKEKLTKAGLHSRIPTLFLSECVLIYLPPEKGDNLIQFVGNYFSTSVFVNYEQINPNDKFGELMVANIQKQGYPLLSIHKFPTIESQAQRYRDNGFQHVVVKDMVDIYKSFLSQEERSRADQVERFDEWEEWNLILSHYVIISAFQDKSKQSQQNQSILIKCGL
eukprot:TRINITY_DN341_c0_g1_i2.p1 TRINITY_DN341_c0_g1~~TRINITY_DN341_c0_g1_i2.p1  ORF type:complete len:175 (-),score=32.98 TRINITY_DN341_c0_g1_i2:150-674(-)